MGRRQGRRTPDGCRDDLCPDVPTEVRVWIGARLDTADVLGVVGHGKEIERGVELLTKLKKNMKPRLIRLWDKLMLRKRALIESVIDQLKNISQVEHSRHRSVVGFMVNLVSGLVAYTHQEKKPSLGLMRQEGSTLPVIIV